MKADFSKVDERLKRYVRSLRKIDEMARFLDVIGRSGEPFLFGGAVRDVAFFGKSKVNDLDIFVSGIIPTHALSEFGSSVRRTRFGGFRLRVAGYEVDVWELDKSHAFRVSSDSMVSVSNLLNSVCFSTDAIAVSFGNSRVIKSPDFSWSFDSNSIRFVKPPLTFEALVAARIARVSLKLGLDLSPIVASYFNKCLEEFGVKGVLAAEDRWGEKKFLNEIALEEVRSKILASVDRALLVLTDGYAFKFD